VLEEVRALLCDGAPWDVPAGVCWVACVAGERVTSVLEAVKGVARHVLVLCDGLCVRVWECSMELDGAGPATISSMQRIRAVMDGAVSDADGWRGVVVEGTSAISSSICISGANGFELRSAGIEEGCCEVSGVLLHR
jgi:hypothetical protein